MRTSVFSTRLFCCKRRFLTLILFFFSFFFSQGVFAQELWYNGWVVMNNGDTLKGKLNYNLYTLDNYHFVKLKDAKGAQRKIIAQHMLSYKVGEYRFKRHIVKNGGKDIADDQAMIKCVTEGPVEVWVYEFDPHVARPSMYQPGGFSDGTQKDYYIIRKGAEPYFLNRLYLYNDLKSQLEDVALLDEILGQKKPQYEDVPEIISSYNQRKSKANSSAK
jgi:hypothetical protein